MNKIQRDQPTPRCLQLLVLGALLLAAVPAFSSESPQAATETEAEPPLATVNGEPILRDDAMRLLERMHQATTVTDREGFDMDRLMDRLVNDLLLSQEARALGMAEEPEIAAKVDKFRDQHALEVIEFKEIGSLAEPTFDEMKRVFKDRYRVVQLRVVSAYEEEEAQAMLRDLQAGADMEAMAHERSVDNIRVRGGLMKPAPKIDLQREVAEAAFAIEVGELAGPIRTKLGWTVIRVEAFEPANPDRLATVEPILRSLLRRDKADTLRTALAQEARQHHEVTVHREIVAALKPTQLPDSRLAPVVTDPTAVVVTVGERSVRADAYGSALIASWKGMRNMEAAEAATPMILDRLITRELLIAEAYRRGYLELPRSVRRIRAYETELLVARYLEEIVAAGVEVTPDQMKAYYEENKNRMLRPPRVRLGQITVGTLAEAERIAALLRDGGDLAWLAEQHSTDGYKSKRGDSGWTVPVTGVDAYHDWLMTAKIGDVWDPAGMNESFVVIQVTDRAEQGPYPYEEVSGNVRNRVFEQEFRTELNRILTILRDRSEIEIDETAVSRLQITGSVDTSPQQGGHGGH